MMEEIVGKRLGVPPKATSLHPKSEQGVCIQVRPRSAGGIWKPAGSRRRRGIPRSPKRQSEGWVDRRRCPDAASGVHPGVAPKSFLHRLKLPPRSAVLLVEAVGESAGSGLEQRRFQ